MKQLQQDSLAKYKFLNTQIMEMTDFKMTDLVDTIYKFVYNDITYTLTNHYLILNSFDFFNICKKECSNEFIIISVYDGILTIKDFNYDLINHHDVEIDLIDKKGLFESIRDIFDALSDDI